MVHLLNLNPFSKESQEIEVELIVVAPSVSSSSESLEFFVMVHKVVGPRLQSPVFSVF